MDKTTYFYPNKTLRLGGIVLDLSTPQVMGILNITPDSFFDGGRYPTVDDALKQAEKMVSEGAAMIDIGGMSSRPGAEIIDVEAELKRVVPVIDAIRKHFPATPISIDTVHGSVAEAAINHGADMINDISAAAIDDSIIDIAVRHQVPYVVMHMQGLPGTMQEAPQYDDVVKEVFGFLLEKCKTISQKGIHQLIIDPGFGFGKTLEQNYSLAKQLEIFHQIGFPIMAGISRKSMICKLLKVNPEKALNGTTALHALLLMKGANILRVHDVKEAKEVIAIAEQFRLEIKEER